MPIEKFLAYHCGPALAGIKPANIMSFRRRENPGLVREIDILNSKLNGRGIYIEVLCECSERLLIMTYRSEKLRAYLSGARINDFLISCGYPENFSLRDYIDILKSRIRAQRISGDEFPHEIGAFLGYPIHDIYGFINHKHTGCLMTGEWKVYAEAEQAARLFHRYKSCRSALLKHINAGKTLEQLFCTA